MTKKKRLTSLNTKLLLTVLISLAVAFAAGMLANALGDAAVDRTYMSPERIASRLESDAAELQSYVKEGNLSVRDNDAIARWTMAKQDVYVLLYQDQRLAVQAGWQGLDTETRAEENLENLQDAVPYPIQFRDGLLQAVFYDYSYERLYGLVEVLSLMVSAAIVVVGLLSYNRRITRAIISVSKEVQSIGQGNLRLQMESKSHDELGDLTAAVEQMRLSLLQKTEEERRALQQNSDLITAMSHDIRNPLTALLGYLELAKNGEFSSQQELQTYLNAAYDKAARLKELSDELFRYSLIFGAKELPMQLEVYDADILLPQMLVEGCDVLQQTGMRFQLAEIPPGGRIRVDVSYLSRVLDNLFDNIRKYADPAEPVRITVSMDQKLLELRFYNRIAKDGKQVESNRIGLRTCSKIMAQMGGSFVKTASHQHFIAMVTLPLVKD